MKRFFALFLIAFGMFFVIGCKKGEEKKPTPQPQPTEPVNPDPTPVVIPTETKEEFSKEEWVKLFDITNYTLKKSWLIPEGTYSVTNYFIFNIVDEDNLFASYYDGEERIYTKRIDIDGEKEYIDLFLKDQFENFKYNKEANKFELYSEYFVTDNNKENIFIHNATVELKDGKLFKITVEVASTSFNNTLYYEFSNIGTTEVVTPDSEVEVEYLTVTEALALATEAGEAGTSDVCYVSGVIDRITNGNFGEMYIKDEENELYIYGLYQNDVVYSKLDDKPYSGDTVYVYGILKTYNGKPEMGKAELVKYEHNETPVDLSEYSEGTVKEARDSEVGSKYILKGVVAYITYANGMAPNGVFLVDETESIYIYDLELASRVAIGDEIEVACERTYFIVSTEIDLAAKWGYLGSCQMVNPILIKQEKSNKEFNKDWIPDFTVKGIMNTSVTENITTSIFKVTAYVKRVPGSGFVNFYIDDLDNATGSYCYSLCNGKDFEYLTEFDGKICTVYLSPFNCKSTNASAFFRFVPVLVLDEGYKMDLKDAPQFVLDYVVGDQFYDKYTSDPELEVVTSVSNEELGFEGVEVTYSTSDENVAKFEDEEGKLVLHVLATGTVTITAKAKLGDVEVTLEKEIECEVDVEYQSITVSEAFSKADGTIVEVRGVVSASLVNQKGFYLIDDTGMIAVRTTQDVLALVKLGDEVIVKGTKTHYTKDATKRLGQLLLEDSELVVNFYGNHEFNKTNLITDKTIDDLLTLRDTNDDITGNYYQVTLYIKKYVSTYTTNYYLTNVKGGDNTIYLYAGSGSQYKWLDPYVDVEATFIVAFTDWNTKADFRACVLAAVDGDNLIINDLNFR